MANPWEMDWAAPTDAAPVQNNASAPHGTMPWEQDWATNSGVTREQAFGYGAADAASLSFGDEGAGVIAGVGAVLGGGDYAMAYRRRVDEARERLEEARRVHPVSTLAGSVAGTVPMMLIPGAGQANAARVAGTAGARVLPSLGRVVTGEALPYGRQLMNAASGRGVGAVLAQGAQGARQGAVFGGVYGAGAANEGDRGAGALQGAGMGLALGAATPFAFQGLTRGNAGENFLAATGNALTRAGTGAALGGASSLLTGADPGQSALAGAALGATAKPFLMGAGRAVGGPLLRAWRNPREAFGNQTGMSIGIPPIGDDAAAAGGGGAGRPTIETPVLREIDRAIGREGRTVSDLETGINAARANPLDRRLADMGPELSGQMDTISNMPGQSFTRAQERAAELAGAMPGQIRAELSEMLNVTRTPGQMIDDLRLAAASANDGYAPVLEQPPIPEVVRSRIAPLMETPEMQPVLAERLAVEQGRARLAQIRGEQAPRPSVAQGPDGRLTLADDISGRQLHELKTSIDDHLNASMDRRSLSPAGRDRQGMLDDFREAYLRAMDDALPGNGDVPGYGQVRATRGSVFDAERALRLDKDGNSTIGAHILKMEPDEIARFMRETVTNTGRRRPTTDFEREAYRAGVAHEIMRRIDDYVSAASDKVRNAGEVLDRVGLQNRLRAAFGETPDAINTFLDRAIQRAEMLRRAGGWTRGSQTARRVLGAGDRFMATIAQSGASPTNALGNLGKATYQALRGRVVERENDAVGSALLRRVDSGSPEDEAYMAELLRRLQQMERDRASRALGSGKDAAVGGLQGGGLADDQAY